MWKAPRRPDYKISQAFNDGFVRIYTVTDTAPPGRLPQETRTFRVRLDYENRRLGIARYYDAKQNQTHVARVIRVPHAGGVTNQEVAQTEDGSLYRIDLVQLVPDVWPLSDDLTLVRYDQGGAGT